ncbi:hypothetical protein ACLK17_13650 [Escherichia coli]
MRDLANLRQHSTTTSPSSGEGDRDAPETGCLLSGETRRKTEALIFGSHDNSTLEMTQRMSTYLDTLWAQKIYVVDVLPESSGNSRVLISTLPLKTLTSGLKIDRQRHC